MHLGSFPVRLDITGKVVKKSAYPVAGGSYADVFQGEYQGALVAIKSPRIVNTTSEKLTKQLNREMETWAQVKHPHVIGLLGFCTDMGPVPCFVSLWLENGTATSFIARNPDADRVKLLRGLAEGLSHLHGLSIVHGDIRGSNTLVTSTGEACISDFGLSHYAGGVTASTTPHGSLRWKAPEMHEPEKFGITAEEAQSSSCDVWSFGMTALELLSGCQPYNCISNSHMVPLSVLGRKHPNKPTPFAYPPKGSIDLWQVCQQCWAYDRKDRPSMEEVSTQIWTYWYYSEYPPLHVMQRQSPERSGRSVPSLNYPRVMLDCANNILYQATDLIYEHPEYAERTELLEKMDEFRIRLRELRARNCALWFAFPTHVIHARRFAKECRLFLREVRSHEGWMWIRGNSLDALEVDLSARALPA